MNLIDYFVESESAGGRPLQHVLNDMNADLNSHYDLSRLGAWRNGKRSTPDSVTRYMLQLTLPHILQKHGINCSSLDEDFINPLVDALTPPKR